jgi:hypothetical protein
LVGEWVELNRAKKMARSILLPCTLVRARHSITLAARVNPYNLFGERSALAGCKRRWQRSGNPGKSCRYADRTRID